MAFSIGASGVYKAVGTMSVGVGGVWKHIIAMSVGAGGAWKSFFSGGLVTTLTAGSYLTRGGGAGYIGYGVYFAGWGFLSPTTFATGGHVAEIGNAAAGSESRVAIRGRGNLGQSFLNFAQVNGVTLTGASASYTYFSGTDHMEWTWSGSSFGLVTSGVYTAIIAIN